MKPEIFYKKKQTFPDIVLRQIKRCADALDMTDYNDQEINRLKTRLEGLEKLLTPCKDWYWKEKEKLLKKGEQPRQFKIWNVDFFHLLSEWYELLLKQALEHGYYKFGKDNLPKGSESK